MSAKSPIRAAQSERGAIRSLAAALANRTPEISALFFDGPDKRQVELPPSLHEALREAVEILVRGDAVSIAAVHKELTTSQAALLLGMSRQFLTRLIDRGDIRCRLVGRHRRLRLVDVLDYRRHRDAERHKAIGDLTAQSAALGAYD
jgi:excisionase family DNA binding protein